MTDICETCGRGIGLNPDDSLAPPVDLSRCLCPDGLECRAVAQAKTFMRFDQQDAARDLLDAIATPPGRDFARAWDNATLMYGRYGQPPTLIDRWRDAVRDREAETLKCEAELDEARILLDRIVRYHDEDRARTPGCTRLVRVIAEAKAWLPGGEVMPGTESREVLALRNVRALAASRIRKTDPENAAHLLRLCESTGIVGCVLRGEPAEAATSERGAQWRTMDTAPKDGTRVNLCVLSGGVAEVVRGRRSDTPGWWATEIGAFTDENVTHWMPIPKPPEVSR